MVHCDNEGAVTVINSGYSRVPEIGMVNILFSSIMTEFSLFTLANGGSCLCVLLSSHN